MITHCGKNPFKSQEDNIETIPIKTIVQRDINTEIFVHNCQANSDGALQVTLYDSRSNIDVFNFGSHQEYSKLLFISSIGSTLGWGSQQIPTIGAKLNTTCMAGFYVVAPSEIFIPNSFVQLIFIYNNTTNQYLKR